MDRLPFARTGHTVTSLGFGAFKIGRNQGTKYPDAYDLPDEDAVAALLHGLLDLGVNYIDTAPAYGRSEARIGQHLAARHSEFFLSTKVGETFEAGERTYDFSRQGIEASVQRSIERLQRPVLDLVLIHSDGRDMEILRQTEAVATLQSLKDRGRIRAIGLSGKTIEGATHALAWADAIMVEYHQLDTSHDQVMRDAAERNVSVIVKKGLAAGHLPPEGAIRFVLAHPAVTTLVIGGLNLHHFQTNIQTAEAVRP